MQGFKSKVVGLAMPWACCLAASGGLLLGQARAADSGLPWCAGVGAASVMLDGQGAGSS